jgi:hypothetical protein
MNYAIAFLGIIFLSATIFWYTSGKYYYTGPVIEATTEETGSQYAVDMVHEIGTQDKGTGATHEMDAEKQEKKDLP